VCAKFSKFNRALQKNLYKKKIRNSKEKISSQGIFSFQKLVMLLGVPRFGEIGPQVEEWLVFKYRDIHFFTKLLCTAAKMRTFDTNIIQALKNSRKSLESNTRV
jgi:hypothetical protein